MLDVASIRQDFPILDRQIDGKPIIYLDSAATSLKPRQVIDAVVEYYTTCTSNVRRGVHPLGDEATERYEECRNTIAGFVGADPREIVLVRNTTEAINLVAGSCRPDARIAYCLGDHHSNVLPWSSFPQARAVGLLPDGALDRDTLQRLLVEHRPELLAITHVTNAFGYVHPVEEIVQLAHRHGCKVLVDGSQSVPHRAVNVFDLECDYLCFSAHKMCGPSGIGALYGSREALRSLRPRILGGSMVSEVHAAEHVLSDIPWRFEAGTPCIEGTFGFAAACDYLNGLGMDAVEAYVDELARYAVDRIRAIPSLMVYGPSDGEPRGAAITFAVPGLEAHALSRLLANRFGILVRSGFHCAQPAHEAIQSPPTVRASFYVYNTREEIDCLADALSGIVRHLA